MRYKATDGKEYDLDILSNEEKELTAWLRREYDTAKSWTHFQARTAQGVITAAHHAKGDEWQNYVPYKIQVDLIANTGIREGELEGTISAMFVE